MKFLLILFLSAVNFCGGKRFLAFFPFPAKSHHFVFRPIIEELARKGHEITYVTGFPYEKPPMNVKQLNILPSFEKEMSERKFDQLAFGELSVPLVTAFLYEIGMEIGKKYMMSPEVQKLLHSNEKFDAVLFESYFVQEYQSAFIHKFNATAIEVMPLGDCLWVNEMAGLPDNIAYQIDYKLHATNELSFFLRLYNMYIKLMTTVIGYIYVWRMQSFVDTYFNYTGWESRPPLSELVKNRSLILTNSHFSVGYSVPLAPHRKEIGGIHLKPYKPLPEDIQKFMDEAKDGVIFMSLGSNINVSDILGARIRDDFIAVFEGLPQRVLLKWETEYPGKLPLNVRISKWFPQQDILAHKNMVLFITHGGLLSIMEAVDNAVPLIGLPVFADQPKNLVFVEAAGFGRMIRFRNLTRDTIDWTLKEVLNNKRYKEEVKRRSVLFKDRRLSPLDEAVYWIEYSLRNPNALTPRGAFISTIALHNLDIFAFFIFIMIALTWVYRKICSFVCRPKTKENGEKKRN